MWKNVLWYFSRLYLETRKPIRGLREEEEAAFLDLVLYAPLFGEFLILVELIY